MTRPRRPSGTALRRLKDFNKNVVITPGNAGTLDMLNRGEIAMGPVWVDMFYSWQADGKLPPNMKLKLASPGMPGQPMYYAVPEKAAQREAGGGSSSHSPPAREVQADGIVKKFNWYPGIDAKNLEGKLDKAAWDKLFTDITPADLAKTASRSDRALFQRHPRGLREEGRQLRRVSSEVDSGRVKNASKNYPAGWRATPRHPRMTKRKTP